MNAEIAFQPKAFTSYDVQMSLFDGARVALFQSAIEAVVKPGDVVVDGGSGTGLLGLLAARAGAARVYCVELSDEYVHVIAENADRNGLADRVIPIHADAITVDLPEEVDVIICEVLSAGFFYEPQLEIVQNLRRFLKPGGAIIPSAVEQFVDLARAQDTLYGLNFTYEARWKILDDVPLTGTVRYLATDFHVDDTSGRITAAVSLRGTGEGSANAIRVTYRIHFTDQIVGTKPSEFLLNPQVIFLSEPVSVVPDGIYQVSMDYQSASNPRHCDVSVTRLRQ